MDQKYTHSQNISAARERVIAHCRELAALTRAQARRPRRAPDEGFDEGVIAVQKTIDAIDRALGRETRLDCETRLGRDTRVATGRLLSFPARARLVLPFPDIEPRRVRFQAGG